MRPNSSKFEDRAVLSRHLAGGNSEGASRLTTGGASTDWLSIAYPMGNLAPSLRRSMPAMNSSDGTGAGTEQQLIQRATAIRHGSFSTEDAASRCQNQQQQQEQQGDVTGGATDQEAKHGRCISSHSLSPLGSMILPAADGRSRSVTANAAEVVDTRQIQVFLKKREDSLTTISSELSDTLSTGSRGTGTGAGGAKSGAIPPAPPQLVHAHHSSRKVLLRGAPTAEPRSFSTQSSVSSSFDSAKEEWLISNFDHSNPSQRVLVLPRPASMQNDNWEEEETAKTPVPPHTLSSPFPPLALSAWHSTSDLTPSARTMMAEKRKDGTSSRRGSAVSGEIGGMDGAEKVYGPISPLPKRPQSQAGHRKSTYLGELVWQVDETVFCGGIDAVQNRNLLCRLNIEYIVDLSGQEDDPSQMDSRPRTEFPCLCSRRTAHSRMTMAMSLKDDSQQQMLGRETRPSTAETKAQLMEREQIIRYFETLIDLIRKARISQKKVLIHSMRGRNRAPAFVAAYLMHCNRITRVQAIKRITKLMCSMRPGLCISDNLQRALMRWQFILGIRAESSRLDSQSLNKMFAVKRNAWL